jgi:hypothetical protein
MRVQLVHREIVLEGEAMMNRRIAMLTTCLLFGVLLLGGFMTLRSASAQSTTQARGAAKESETQCSLSTLNGRYVFALDGFQIVGSDRVPFAFAGFSVFNGRGHVQGVFSQSVNGKITSHIHFTGTYTVSPNCIVTETDNAAGVTFHFDEFTTPDGRLLTFVQTDPGIVTSGVETRETSQRVGN